MTEARSLIYAVASGPGDRHAPTDHLYPALENLFEQMKTRDLITDYTILKLYKEEPVSGRREISETFKDDLHFLLLGNHELEGHVLTELENYEAETLIDKTSVFDKFVCFYDPGTCLGKAITSEDNLPRIESEVLAEMGFTKLLKQEGAYIFSDGIRTMMGVKFIR